MDYRLRVGERTETVSVSPGETGDRAGMTLGGTAHEVSWSMVDPFHLHLVVDGRTFRVFGAETEGGTILWIEGRPYRVEDLDLGVSGPRRRAGAEASPGQVTPPMPAVVIRILVTEGERVVKGQGLLVVAAMKMETTLKAPYGGTVTRIAVALQAKVAPGDILVTIEKEEEHV